MHRQSSSRSTGRHIVLAVVAALAVAGILITAGCGGGDMPAAGNIDNATAKSLVKQGVRLVDVRTVSEFEAGHIPDAENVPLDQLASAMASWDPAEPILLYCATGSRSVEAMRTLTSAGFKTVYNLTDGIVAWDGDVTTGASAVAAGSLPPSASGLPVMYEFYTDW